MLRRWWKVFVVLAPFLWLAVSRLEGKWLSRQESPRLLAAARAGDRRAVIFAMDNGATADTKDGHQCTALMLAAERGDINIVRFLLDSGAKVNFRDEHGRTALMLATAADAPDLVALLIFWKADINARSDDGVTALKLARTLAGGTNLSGGAVSWPVPEHRRHFAQIVRTLEQVGARE